MLSSCVCRRFVGDAVGRRGRYLHCGQAFGRSDCSLDGRRMVSSCLILALNCCMRILLMEGVAANSSGSACNRFGGTALRFGSCVRFGHLFEDGMLLIVWS